MRKGEGGRDRGMEEGLLCFTPLRKAGIAFFGRLLGVIAGGWAWQTSSGDGGGGGRCGESILFTSSRFDKARH